MNSPNHEIFISCPIGFESLQLKEINDLAQHFEIKNFSAAQILGGITIGCEDYNFLQIIPFLKISTRALYRLGEFKVRDFPKLFNKIKKFAWGDILFQDKFEIKVSLKESRLIHSDRTKKTITDGIETWLKGNPRKKIKKTPVPEQILFFHLQNDVCVVSIDLGGGPLYKRATRNLEAIAPIRENLAAGMIKFTLAHLDVKNVKTLVDPMCGSGTFIEEALKLNLPSHLNFAYPCIPKIKINPTEKASASTNLQSIIGIEKNNYLNENFLPEFSKQITYLSGDFKDHLKDIPPNALFIFNPPYGKRIKIKGSLTEYYHQIIKDILTTSPLAIGLIIPEEINLKTPKNFKRDELHFKNGGLRVKYILFYQKD